MTYGSTLTSYSMRFWGENMRVVLAFAILAVMVSGGLWVLGFIGGGEAADSTGKVIGLIAIIGVGIGAVTMVLRGNKSAHPESSDKPGPKF